MPFKLGVETSELLAATRDCLDHLATASDENVFRISTNLSEGLEAAALHVKQEIKCENYSIGILSWGRIADFT